MANVIRVGNFVQFPVSLVINDFGADKTYKFFLAGKRISREQMFAALGVDTLSDATDAVVNDFLVGHLTGWAEQTIVIDEATGQPSAFSEDGLRLVLDLWGVTAIVFSGYLQALGIKDGSTAKDARSKN